MSKNTYKNDLADIQQQAIDAFIRKAGRNWKSELRNCWRLSRYPGIAQEHAATLQQLRNSHGPKWLGSYRVSGHPAGDPVNNASAYRRLVVEVKDGNVTLTGDGNFDDIDVVLFDRDCEDRDPDELVTIDAGIGRRRKSGVLERLDVDDDAMEVGKVFEALDDETQTAAPGR